MKLTIDKTNLLRGLGIAQKAVGSSSLNPILGCVLLQAQEDGIQLTSTDLELAIRTGVIYADVSKCGAVALEARMFLDMVKRLPEGDIEIAVNDNYNTDIKCKKVAFKLVGSNPKEFPAFPEVSKESGITINSEAFSSMIRQTVFAVSDNPNKPNLNGLLVKIESGNVDIVAVDGFRVAYRHSAIDNDGFSASAIVPGQCIAEIGKLMSACAGDATVYFTDKHILFELYTCGHQQDGRSADTIVSRLIDGEFVKYKTVLDVDGGLPVKADRRELLECLERSMLVSSEGNQKQPVRFDIEPDAITVTSLAAKSAIHESIRVDTDIENRLSLIFNPRYFIDTLKAIDDAELVIRFVGELAPFVAEPVDKGNYKYLMMPLNPKAWR